jgi:hypothetical protein
MWRIAWRSVTYNASIYLGLIPVIALGLEYVTKFSILTGIPRLEAP